MLASFSYCTGFWKTVPNHGVFLHVFNDISIYAVFQNISLANLVI